MNQGYDRLWGYLFLGLFWCVIGGLVMLARACLG